MKLRQGLALATLAAVVPFSVIAQSGETWSDVDCVQSRLAATAGAKCRATNVISGGEGAGGQWRKWSIRTDNPYQHIYLSEGLASQSYIPVKETGAEFLKWMNIKAREAGNLTGPTNRSGVDYFTFTSKSGEECAGFRRFGPTRSVGYAWLMGGVLCLPKGSKLETTRIAQFIDSAQLK